MVTESSPQASPPGENVDAKAEFRKPSGEAANRKYRRRSPLNGSSSSDDSPTRDQSTSPASGRISAKISETRHRKDDRRDLNRDSGRSLYGRSDESYRRSDRQSSRSSHSYNRHDDYDGCDKYAHDSERAYSKLSFRSGLDSRGNNYSDQSKRDNESRLRDSPRESERYSRDKPDGSGHRSRDKERETLHNEYKRYKDKDLPSDKDVYGRRHASSSVEDVRSRDRRKEDRDARDYKTESRKASGDYRGNHSPVREDSWSYGKESTSRRDRSGHRLQESSRGDTKGSNADNYRKSEKKKYDDQDKYKQRYYEESGEKTEDRNSSPSKGRDSPAKKPKLFGMDACGQKIDDEKQSSSSKQSQESAANTTSERAYVTDSDIDAAKIAAMKAAELVNRNLIGTGYMSTEQKKKLLWGNKKSTPAEESARHWDTSIFGDRERQEKFNKLMSLSYLWPIVGCEGRYQSRAQARNERCREAENRAGLGKAIHCRASTERWSHCWVRSLRIFKYCRTSSSVFRCLLYFGVRYLCLMIFHHSKDCVPVWLMLFFNIHLLRAFILICRSYLEIFSSNISSIKRAKRSITVLV